MKPKSLPLLVIALIFCTTLFSQEKKDTIYFDKDWSICEQPVAEYYRVCTLNRGESFFYKGNAEDYYINGNPEMTGSYNASGKKEGNFVFYDEHGVIRIKGQYNDDNMMGNWDFYDSAGRLTTEINCKSEEDFVPTLIISKHGDTLFKNGSGMFVFNMADDLPEAYYGRKNFTIEGEVKDGLRNGTFNFYSTLPKKKLLFSLTYKNGKLKNSETQYSNIEPGFAGVPDYELSPAPSNLAKIDQFYHSNMVFGFGPYANSKLVNFLTDNETPFIESTAKESSENDLLFFSIIENVLKDTILRRYVNRRDEHYSFFGYPVELYFNQSYSKNERNTFLKIEGNITLTIDTSGYIINSAFSSNLTQKQINKMNYYFSRVSDLAPYQVGDEKIMKNINIALDVLIDTLKNDSFHVNYLMYNTDSVDSKDLADYILKDNDSTVQVEAKFPGDWIKFLERNLNAQTPADHGAPIGRYTVTVSFIVNTDGTISDVRTLNDPGYGTAEEAIRVIKRGPNWIPAIKDGRNVVYRQKQNIVFQVGGR